MASGEPDLAPTVVARGHATPNDGCTTLSGPHWGCATLGDEASSPVTQVGVTGVTRPQVTRPGAATARGEQFLVRSDSIGINIKYFL